MEELGFRTLPRARCVELLATAPVGRVGVSVGALPAVLPVNYVVAGERLVFRTAEGTKLDAALARSVVAFEADGYHPEGEWGWSVLVQGVASEITAPGELAAARALPLHPWALGERAGRYVCVPLTVVTGRAFGRLPPL